jgi:hypothetical protein
MPTTERHPGKSRLPLRGSIPGDHLGRFIRATKPLRDGHPYLTFEEAIEIDTAASYLAHTFELILFTSILP